MVSSVEAGKKKQGDSRELVDHDVTILFTALCLLQSRLPVVATFGSKTIIRPHFLFRHLKNHSLLFEFSLRVIDRLSTYVATASQTYNVTGIPLAKPKRGRNDFRLSKAEPQ